MSTIDYYSGQGYGKREDLLDRERIALRLLADHLHDGTRVLDVGCGDGMFLDALDREHRGLDLHGLDFSIDRLAQAKNDRLQLKQCDISQGLPIEGASFDVVYSGEVVEHLFDPDAYIREIARVLKRGGRLLLTTPNLAAWYNRGLLLFGVQPLFIESSTVDSAIGTGILKRMKKQSRPVGHVRIFNLDAVRDLLEAYGFRIVTVSGASFERFPNALRSFDRAVARVPSLASNLIVLAEKN